MRADVGDDLEGDEAPGSDMDEKEGSEGMPADEEEKEGSAEGDAAAVPSTSGAGEDAAGGVFAQSGAGAERASRGGWGGRRKSQGRRQLALQPTMPRLPDTLHPRNAGVQSQAAMEEEFFNFFGELVSEWNPCYSTDGRARYTWDEEIGAHDVEMCVPCGDESNVMELCMPCGGEGTDSGPRLPAVDVRCPERTRLRALLDAVLRDEQAGKPIDLQPVRRLVAALVQTSGRHT